MIMPLKKYKAKRNLKKSGEPRGIIKEKGSAVGNHSVLRFVIHRHDASHLHWDLRLEMNRVLKSWAIPKEPPKTKGIKRLAIKVEDHPLAYTKFKGIIPEGNYGAGKVEIWDNGTYELIEKTPDKIEFKLNGKKMKGNFVLVRTKYGNKPEKSWLFFKV